MIQQQTERMQRAYKPYDPDSLLTQAESDAGFTYGNSYRKFNKASDWHAACEGKLTPDEIAKVGPRVLFEHLQKGRVA